ncbi:hypothetical protein G9A89_018511 [Geosiphon pyriformis]|nr:hypothetical protein G9A89_018511 [Geosiphon pyriformis]
MSQDYQRAQTQFYPPTFKTERSWSMLANETFLEDETNDDVPPPSYHQHQQNYTMNSSPLFISEKSWSVLPATEAEERRFLNYGNFNNSPDTAPITGGIYSNHSHGPLPEYSSYPHQKQTIPESLTCETTAAFPEPEFQPSLGSSAKEFLEETFRYERRSAADFVGSPDEYRQHQSGIFHDDSDITPRSSKIYHHSHQQQELPRTETGSGIGWYSIIGVPIIGAAVVAYLMFFN